MTWSGRREGGSRFLIWLYGRIGVHLGRPFARVFLWPIAIYFFARRRAERVASRAFLSRAFGRRATFLEVMRHIYIYSATILDRVFLLSGPIERFDVRVHGLDELNRLLRPDRGLLLLGAHIGSFEVLRSLGRERPDVEVRVVMDRKQTPVLTELLHELNPDVRTHIIDAGGDPAELALKMAEAAGRGMLIGLLGDRTRPGQATEPAEFFGETARFPTAPYLLASVLQIPIVLCFGLY
ncbi:MAG TPA: acyltransferase, partial [Rudaea sp.]